jgi:hypothetical protein
MITKHTLRLLRRFYYSLLNLVPVVLLMTGAVMVAFSLLGDIPSDAGTPFMVLGVILFIAGATILACIN